MGKTLTIVARRPSCTDPYDSDALIDEQDLAIELLMAKLRARTDTAHHSVFRATTVKQLIVCRKKYDAAGNVSGARAARYQACSADPKYCYR